MKKFLVLMMSLMMAFALVACGGEEEASAEPAEVVEEVVEEEAVEEVVEEAVVEEEVVEEEVVEETVEEEAAEEALTGGPLFDLPLAETPDSLTSSPWIFTGAMFDGAELSDEEYAALLEEIYGGSLEFVFNDDGSAQMKQGGGTADGVYEVVEGSGLRVTFDIQGTEEFYACCFTPLEDGTPIMVAMFDETGSNALYFAQ